MGSCGSVFSFIMHQKRIGYVCFVLGSALGSVGLVETCLVRVQVMKSSASWGGRWWLGGWTEHVRGAYMPTLETKRQRLVRLGLASRPREMGFSLKANLVCKCTDDDDKDSS